MVFDKKKKIVKIASKTSLQAELKKLDPLPLPDVGALQFKLQDWLLWHIIVKKKVNCGKTHFYNNNKNPS